MPLLSFVFLSVSINSLLHFPSARSGNHALSLGRIPASLCLPIYKSVAIDRPGPGSDSVVIMTERSESERKSDGDSQVRNRGVAAMPEFGKGQG